MSAKVRAANSLCGTQLAATVKDGCGVLALLDLEVCRRIRGRLGSSQDDRGATATEYALMVSLIAVVIIASVTLFGQNIIPLFNVPANAL